MPSISLDSVVDTVLPYVYMDKIRVQRIINEEFKKLPPTQVYTNGRTNFGKPVSYSDSYLSTETKSTKRLNLNLSLILSSESINRYRRDKIVYVCTFVCRNAETRSYLQSGNFSFHKLNDLIIQGVIDFNAIPFTDFYDKGKKGILSITNKTGFTNRTGFVKISYEHKIPIRMSDGMSRSSELSVYSFLVLTDRNVNIASTLTTFPLFGYSYGPILGNFVITSGQLNKNFFTFNTKNGDLWAGGYHRDPTKKEDNSYVTGLTFSGDSKKHQNLKLTPLITSNKVVDDTIIERMGNNVPLPPIPPSISYNIIKDNPGILIKGSLKDTSIYKNLTYISPLYTSINSDGVSSTIFHFDKKNILKSFSRYGSYLSSITEPVTLGEIYSLTVLKRVNITREFNNIVETVATYEIGKELNYLEKLVHYSKIRNTNDSNVVFSTFQRINTFSQNQSMNSYVFKDYFVNSTLRDKFKYKIELTFDDGYEKLIETKYIRFMNELKFLSNIYQFIHINRAYESDGKISVSILDSYSPSSIKNLLGFSYSSVLKFSTQIDMKLKYIFASYLDLLMLVNQGAVSDPGTFMESFMSLLGTQDGNINQYENMITKLENFRHTIISNMKLSLTLQTDQRVIDNIPKLKKENKDDSIKLQTYSDFVFGKTKDTTLVDNIPQIKNTDSQTFPELELSDIVPIIIANTYMPSKMYIDNMAYDIDSNYSDKFILFHNQGKGLDADPTKVGVYSAEISSQITKEELGSRKRLLDALGSTGITVLGTTTVQKDASNRSFVESSRYLTNFNTPEDVARQSSYETNNTIDVNFPLDLSSLVAKKVLTSQRNLYSPNAIAPNIQFTSTNPISEYPKILFSQLLKYKIQILNPYPQSNDAQSITQFSEEWIDLTSSNLDILEQDRIFLARTIVEGGDLTNINVKDELNFLHVNQYFVLKTQDISNLLNVTPPAPNGAGTGLYGPIPFNPYLSQIFTFENQPHNVTGINALYQVDYLTLQRMFSFSVIINQPRQVTVFGTNFDAIMIPNVPSYASQSTSTTEKRQEIESSKEKNILSGLNPQIKLDNINKKGKSLNQSLNPTSKLGY